MIIKIEAIVRPEKVDSVKNALAEAGVVGLNIVNVLGRGAQQGVTYVGRTGERVHIDLLPKAKVEVVVPEEMKEKVLNTILKVARTGNIGDGKIFISPVSEVIRVRTGERGEAAI